MTAYHYIVMHVSIYTHLDPINVYYFSCRRYYSMRARSRFNVPLELVCYIEPCHGNFIVTTSE